MKKKQLRIIKNKIRYRDWLLVIGLCLAPMTGLRVGKIGPAELLCLLWGIKYIPFKKYCLNSTFKFFFCFFFAMSIGTAIGSIIAPEELVMTDWYTWIYLALVAILFYEGIKKNTKEYNERILYLISVLSVLWYTFLYEYSIRVSAMFFGAPLWYRGMRFTGGANNPHQVAVLMCGVCFVFVRSIVRGKRKILSAICCALSVFVIIQTASSTGILSIVCSALAAVYLSTVQKIHNIKARRLMLAIELILIIGIVVINYHYFYVEIYDWIARDPNGIGRFAIFRTIADVLRKSPLFGLGPGIHALNGTKEFHNTYLEIIACSGLAGFIFFVVYSYRVFKLLLEKDISLVPIAISIYVYGIAGFSMRRLAYWGVLIFIIVISEQSRNVKEIE